MNYQPPKPKPASTLSKKEIEERRIKDEESRKLRSVEVARAALGLKPWQIAPKPNLSVKEAQALGGLNPEDRSKVEDVVGCAQEMKIQIERSKEAAVQIAGANQMLSQRTSFSQQLMIRRAEMGNMGPEDIERSRTIIETQTAKGRADPVSSGANAIFYNSQDMMASCRLLSDTLKSSTNEIPPEVTELIDRTTNEIAQSLEAHQTAFTDSNLEQLRVAVRGREGVRAEAVIQGVLPGP